MPSLIRFLKINAIFIRQQHVIKDLIGKKTIPGTNYGAILTWNKIPNKNRSDLFRAVTS